MTTALDTILEDPCGAPSPDSTLACEMPSGHPGDHGAWTLEEAQRDRDAALGAAWRRCEAALPEGWEMDRLIRRWVGGLHAWWNAAANRGNGTLEWAEGPTPTAALEALAEKLEGMK